MTASPATRVLQATGAVTGRHCGAAAGGRRWLALFWPDRRTREHARRISPTALGASRGAAMPEPEERRSPRGDRRVTRWLKTWQQDHRRRLAARAQARAHAPFQPGERLLAVARAADGGLAVATDRALHHQHGRSWARLGWEQVDQARWGDQEHVLALTSLTPAVAAPIVLRLAFPWDLPEVARERVTWARVVDQRVWLNGRAGARVVARRAPGQPSVRWLVILDRGLDPADPAVQAAVASALTDLRTVTGADETADE
jgi:hypothetical protein